MCLLWERPLLSIVRKDKGCVSTQGPYQKRMEDVL